jgi:hemolysin III
MTQTELDMCPHSPIDRNRLTDSGPVSGTSAARSSEVPGKISWNYDRAELIADGVIHATGVVLGIVGAIAAIVLVAVEAQLIEAVSVGVYIFGLVAMLVLSAAYNMWPISSTKWILRRFDHSAIYLLIAGTYTPFLAVMKSGIASMILSIGVWSSALIGIAVKLMLPGRFDRLAIALYLLLGWCGVAAYDLVASAVPTASLWLLVIGGILYSIGTIFHGWRRLRFHNAIWHGFVLIAAGCHYSAVLTCLASG